MNEQLAQQMAQMFANGQMKRAQTPQIGVAAGATGAVPAQSGMMAPQRPAQGNFRANRMMAGGFDPQTFSSRLQAMIAATIAARRGGGGYP